MAAGVARSCRRRSRTLPEHRGPGQTRPCACSRIPLLANIGGAFFVGRDVAALIRRRLNDRHTGAPIPRDVLETIEPGLTTYAQVMELCGRPDEEHEHLSPVGRRTLLYRGTGRLPRAGAPRRWPRSSRRGDVEHYEVAIDLDGDRVQAVQSRVRRVRPAS
jgi:hypothetical protein